MDTYTLAKRDIPLHDGWGVIVAGGGPAGCAAATAAAREGAKTLLIEDTGALGGMGTQGLVPWFCGYADGEKIIARGLAEQIRQALVNGMPHVAEGAQGWWPAIDPELLKRTYDGLVTGAGATVLFQSRLCGVEVDGAGRVQALLVSNKAGLQAYRASCYVDCTGDGDLAAWAGAPFEKGDAAGGLQPATHCFMLTNVEPYDCWYSPPRPGEPPRPAPSLHFFDPASPVHQAAASDRYPLIVDKHSCSTQIGPAAYGYNFGHVYDVDNTNPENVSRALIHGRKQAEQYRRAFTDMHPAFAGAFLAATGSLLGIRETRRITGDYVLSLDDYLARRDFPDEICRNAYNIDVHRRGDIDAALARKLDSKELADAYEKDVKQLGKGESYGVPYRCLTPRTLRNVLVAGRCISTDRPVNGSVRIMACCLTTGEAAGVAAAMTAAAHGPDVHAVDTRDLRDRLRHHGAYLPPSSLEKNT